MADAGPPPARYDDLRAIYLNCTLTPSPGESHTDKLVSRAVGLLRDQGVEVTVLRAVDQDIAPGIYPDMTEHGAERDDWPGILEQIMDADIVVLATPIWLGEKSSICQKVIERLYSASGLLNDDGQYAFYGTVGGCLVTGNEDGIKHIGMGVLYSLQHVGFTIPPQADAGWIGEAGPGPSYGDEVEGSDVPAGYDNDFTDKNTTFATWNLLHLARMLKDAGGLPAYGNQQAAWNDGVRFGLPPGPR